MKKLPLGGGEASSFVKGGSYETRVELPVHASGRVVPYGRYRFQLYDSMKIRSIKMVLMVENEQGIRSDTISFVGGELYDTTMQGLPAGIKAYTAPIAPENFELYIHKGEKLYVQFLNFGIGTICPPPQYPGLPGGPWDVRNCLPAASFTINTDSTKLETDWTYFYYFSNYDNSFSMCSYFVKSQRMQWNLTNGSFLNPDFIQSISDVKIAVLGADSLVISGGNKIQRDSSQSIQVMGQNSGIRQIVWGTSESGFNYTETVHTMRFPLDPSRQVRMRVVNPAAGLMRYGGSDVSELMLTAAALEQNPPIMQTNRPDTVVSETDFNAIDLQLVDAPEVKGLYPYIILPTAGENWVIKDNAKFTISDFSGFFPENYPMAAEQKVRLSIRRHFMLPDTIMEFDLKRPAQWPDTLMLYTGDTVLTDVFINGGWNRQVGYSMSFSRKDSLIWYEILKPFHIIPDDSTTWSVSKFFYDHRTAPQANNKNTSLLPAAENPAPRVIAYFQSWWRILFEQNIELIEDEESEKSMPVLQIKLTKARMPLEEETSLEASFKFPDGTMVTDVTKPINLFVDGIAGNARFLPDGATSLQKEFIQAPEPQAYVQAGNTNVILEPQEFTITASLLYDGEIYCASTSGIVIPCDEEGISVCSGSASAQPVTDDMIIKITEGQSYSYKDISGNTGTFQANGCSLFYPSNPQEKLYGKTAFLSDMMRLSGITYSPLNDIDISYCLTFEGDMPKVIHSISNLKIPVYSDALLCRLDDYGFVDLGDGTNMDLLAEIFLDENGKLNETEFKNAIDYFTYVKNDMYRKPEPFTGPIHWESSVGIRRHEQFHFEEHFKKQIINKLQEAFNEVVSNAPEYDPKLCWNSQVGGKESNIKGIFNNKIEEMISNANKAMNKNEADAANFAATFYNTLIDNLNRWEKNLSNHSN